MPVHYFHCSDGVDLVLDRAGHNTRSKRDLHSRACLTAERIMDAVPPGLDWSNWVVSVHDTRGVLVELVPFPRSAERKAA